MMDDVDVELHLIPTPSSPDLPLGAFGGGGGWVGEEQLGHIMVAQLLRHVGQHWIIVGE
jgi:hypothetical protein